MGGDCFAQNARSDGFSCAAYRVSVWESRNHGWASTSFFAVPTAKLLLGEGVAVEADVVDGVLAPVLGVVRAGIDLPDVVDAARDEDLV